MADEYTTLGSLTLDVAGCIEAHDLTPLLNRGGVRGGDVTVERLDGDVPRGRKRASWRFALSYNLYGTNDFTGSPHVGSRRLGVIANLATLRAAVQAPYAAGNTVTLTHHLEDASTRFAEVIVEDIAAQALDSPQKGDVLRLVLDIVCPAGQLEVPVP